MSVTAKPYNDSYILHKQGFQLNHVWYNFYYDKETCPFCKIQKLIKFFGEKQIEEATR
jgi:hypothetical protein